MEEVAGDWKKIAARWPFLDIWVTLMNGENCETPAPLVTIHVSNGALTYFKGTEEPHRNAPARDMEDAVKHVMNYSRGGGYSHEHGLPDEWIDEFAAKVRPIVESVLTS